MIRFNQFCTIFDAAPFAETDGNYLLLRIRHFALMDRFANELHNADIIAVCEDPCI